MIGCLVCFAAAVFYTYALQVLLRPHGGMNLKEALEYGTLLVGGWAFFFLFCLVLL